MIEVLLYSVIGPLPANLFKAIVCPKTCANVCGERLQQGDDHGIGPVDRVRYVGGLRGLRRGVFVKADPLIGRVAMVAVSWMPRPLPPAEAVREGRGTDTPRSRRCGCGARQQARATSTGGHMSCLECD
jgi:hypothetical protein